VEAGTSRLTIFIRRRIRMANNSISVLALDFATYRAQLVQYLQAQDRFKDYNFDASNLSVLIDLLALNTYNNGFYASMIGAEQFLDSSQLRDSVISHAKDLNYTPRSNKSSVANINIQVTTSDNTKSIVIPKYTSFTGRVGSNTYTFTTNSAVVAVSNSNVIIANNITIYEGILTTEQFVFNPNTNQRFILSNPNIDTSSLFVNVIEDSGSTMYNYMFADNLFGLTANSTVYFLQAASSGNYEIIFGDGVSGRIPKAGAIISAEYRISSGSFANNISTFTSDGLIGGYANVVVSTNEPAYDGAFAESLASIKFNAPRHYTVQEKASNEDDYESLLIRNFPEIYAVEAIGGEDLNPPQFGKILITVALNNLSVLPQSKITTYTNFLKSKMPLGSKPIFANPDFTYLTVNCTVKYDTNVTDASQDTIESIVQQTIVAYNNANLKNFRVILYDSPLGTMIDDSDPSIISNERDIKLTKKFPVSGISLANTARNRFSFIFNQAILNISSDFFYRQGAWVAFADDGNGIINLIDNTGKVVSKNHGTVNYETGFINTGSLIERLIGNTLNFYAEPVDKDITAPTQNIMLIDPVDINVNAIAKKGKKN
jgi:hypothetical protein